MYDHVRLILKVFLSIIIVASPGCRKEDPSTFASLEEEINSIADQYVKVGAIVGVINKQNVKFVFSYGTKLVGEVDLPDANTIFEIGSITKTFTATLTADMYLKGLIQDDVVEHYLPSNEVNLPKKDNIEITFTHLLTHTSGMPRTPDSDGSGFPLPPGYDINNPYAAFTTEQVYNYLTNYCTLKFTPGTWWEYSNTGVGLVGHIVGLIDGTSYQTVLTRDLITVLDMNNTSLYLTEDQKLNFATGYNGSNKIMPSFTANDIFQGCGMIKSSLNDMFKYLEANMGLVYSPLENAMELTHQKVMHQGSMGDQGLAWLILELSDGQKIIYSAGNTIGQSAYLAFNKKESTGAIILLNSSNLDGSNIKMGEAIMKAIVKY